MNQDVMVINRDCVPLEDKQDWQEKEELFFPEILRSFFTEEMIRKISRRQKDKETALILQHAIGLAVEVVEFENRTGMIY
jgi:hypothetical protein